MIMFLYIYIEGGSNENKLLKRERENNREALIKFGGNFVNKKSYGGNLVKKRFMSDAQLSVKRKTFRRAPSVKKLASFLSYSRTAKIKISRYFRDPTKSYSDLICTPIAIYFRIDSLFRSYLRYISA